MVKKKENGERERQWKIEKELVKYKEKDNA